MCIPISIYKQVRVISETTTGRNVEFKDILSGKRMSRIEFVRLIKQGYYPGYEVIMMHGLETPRSKADGLLNNNLG